MYRPNRRTFLTTSISAAAAARAAGANDAVNAAVIGLRGRGRDHIAAFAAQSGLRIVAVCDVDKEVLERGAGLVERATGSKPKVYADLRRLFEDKSIDVVTVATPNHWHALATIWACQAGKDVYVEKPASHEIWEGERMVEAARKYNRVVQCGMQARSLSHYNEAIRLVRGGEIGKVYMARGLCYKRRKSIGRQPDSSPPPTVDYDTWLGPAPRRPFNANRFHYNWHWFWDTGNGDIANQGVHEMDIARWGLGKTTLPNQVFSTGAKYIYDDDQETPNTQTSVMRWSDCQLEFEVRGIYTGGENAMRPEGTFFIGVTFFGSEGYLTVDCNGYQVFMGEKRELIKQASFREPEPWDTKPHAANFLAAVRSRRSSELTAEIGEGVLSASLCHLSNISYRTGRALRLNPATGAIENDPDASALLTRYYRPPFVVPAKV
jgi:predicted dehydrogenase